MDESLSLKWNNHCSTFLQVLCNVRNKQKYADVTLACAGKFYNAHKIVLSSCSDYFKEMFDMTDSKNLVVLLKDIKTAELEILLDYMYLGEVKVKQAELSSLIHVAECLQIKGLAVTDEELMEKTCHAESCTYSPQSKKKRNLDDNDSNISPPTKQKPNEILPTNIDEGVKIGELISDVDDMENIAAMNESDQRKPMRIGPVISMTNFVDIKEEYQHEIFSVEDDYLHDNTHNKPNTEDADMDPLFEPTRSELYKTLTRNDRPCHMRNMHPGSSFNEETSEWSGDAFHAGASSLNADSDSNQSSSNNYSRGKHACPICGELFSRADNMRRHSLTHSGERPFSCPNCAYRSARRGDLRQHMARIHNTELNNYNC